MNRVEVAETGQILVRLAPEQGRRLAGSGVVEARLSPYETDLWEITPRGKVGVALVGDVEVWVIPKLAIDRLLFLVGYTADPKGWRDETVLLDVRTGLIPAVAQALWRQTERVLRQGLLQGYRTVEESSYVLRGRLREGDQLRWHHGRVIPIEIRHDDFTVDIPENQILLAAITRLLTVPRVDGESRRRLAALRRRLAEVTSLVRGTKLPAWQPSRLNTRYHTALRLSEIVWRATSPEHSPGAVAANGFLFDLPKIFEDFVTVAVSEELHAQYGGAAYPQYECHLDEALAVRMRPDLVWEMHGRPQAVADAKYKQEKPGGYPDADLYQMLAYCTALRLPRGHLIYAKGNVHAATHVVQHAGIEIVCHALDLTEPPEVILSQVSRIVAELAANPQATRREVRMAGKASLPA
ncbi:McrBC 5-methylcytosine restriction system component [Sphaerisporangium melleum]|uniref:McrBC 5-methylcytosine restriction system component n=1 Tax=Sphaerisporangium melleum TaxID=321316 RepID=A0A917VH91_9ACTN|nr:restriction endonuclease [Sphaerisporangium melleum]GGK81745.1 McrBC 5-methylcytosine restriction system component [Sphaerisporangium melleum]GII73809.1 McrBC 5-methylcytosine restriction system component [Sphaerisporangium melleum]